MADKLSDSEEAFVARIEADIKEQGIEGLGVVRGRSFEVPAQDDDVFVKDIEARVKDQGIEGLSVVGAGKPVAAAVHVDVDGKPIDAGAGIIHAGVHVTDPLSEFAVRLEDVVTPSATPEARPKKATPPAEA